MAASRSSIEVRSSEGFSEGRSDDMRWVGVGGGDGEKSFAGGAGRGSGNGLGRSS